ncbi:2'-5' RNA ligase family protein [Nocardioides alcanivorans]|uniref:2'-5' RNA ligase family protein n=1 Tax=Nocardioides alcanivorans TaxID=2897352 RepID=UPI001F22C190|nr:2'-5' RNA ligase family protein [Nocardioides alcanivorans]
MPTVGVAIAIPEPWASRLQDYRTSIGDTTAALIPTHVTLVPPTDFPEPGELSGHLEAVARVNRPFTLHLRGTGTFRPVSPVVFVGVVEGISACERLAAGVRSGPLSQELAFPYHPHVTVAHHLPDPVLDRAFAELADFDCQFDVEAFHLYVHDEVVGWQVTSSYPLGE